MIGSVAAFTQAPPWLDAAVAQIDQNRGLPGKLLKDQLPDVGYALDRRPFLRGWIAVAWAWATIQPRRSRAWEGRA
jgi:bifunctional pyridoxal-dependent enzyme with beta-cystathionase and maltose regulon repressor activities